MHDKVYESSTFNRILYGFMASCVLIPGLWLMIYLLGQRTYSMSTFVIGAVLCSYVILILQKLFSYKVIAYDECLEIKDVGGTIRIRYDEITDIKLERDSCCLVDSINHGQKGKCYILQKAYLKDYDQLVEYVFLRAGIQGAIETARMGQWNHDAKSYFISASLLKQVDEKEASLKDILKAFFPYFLLMTIFFMGLVEYGVWIKGRLPSSITIYVELVFPMFAVVTTYMLVLKYMHYVKKLMDSEYCKIDLPVRNIAIFLFINIAVSSLIIVFFFYMLNKANI